MKQAGCNRINAPFDSISDKLGTQIKHLAIPVPSHLCSGFALNCLYRRIIHCLALHRPCNARGVYPSALYLMFFTIMPYNRYCVKQKVVILDSKRHISTLRMIPLSCYICKKARNKCPPKLLSRFVSYFF